MSFVLPSWLDPESLRWVILVVVGLVFYLVFLVVRFTQRLLLKVVFLAGLAALGAALWWQREDLKTCAQTCDCSVFGQTVEIPWQQLPEEVRIQLAQGDIGCGQSR